MNEKYKVMDLFAGIGGFSLGFSLSGFNIVTAIEQNMKSCAIYKENFPDVEIICSDIRTIDMEHLPDFEVLIGWIPTVCYSFAGKKGILEDNLIKQEIELIKIKRPKAFVLETNAQNKDIKTKFLNEVIDLGYNTETYLLESNKITGIPIRERRLYIVGVLSRKVRFEFPKQIDTKKTFIEVMQNASELNNWERRYITYSELNKNTVIVNPYKDLISSNYIRIPYVEDNIGIRRVTSREYARLKGFPDCYRISVINKWEVYRYISQATNVQVAKMLADKLKEILNMETDNCKTTENEQQKVKINIKVKNERTTLKDLTNSQTDRQNILNNEMALNEIRESSNIKGILFEEKFYFTKTMISSFYDIDIRTIERYVAENIDELTQNGYEILKGIRLKKFIEIVSLLDVPDMNVGNISNRTPQLAIFDFKSFLNIGMLLVESENARVLRQAMLNIVIDFINKKTGGATKYINQRDKDFLSAYLQEEDYRREFTDALRDYVDMGQFKYAMFTDMIYQSIFKEEAKEYREILKLKKKDRTRETFYSEILDLIASYECGLAEVIKEESKNQGRKLSTWETQRLFKSFENLPHWKPLILRARSKMASRDLALRDAFHKQLEEYIKPLEKEEYEKFLGIESDTIQKLMEENQDVLRRLKERE